MRVSSLKYLLSEGFKNVWKNWMMSMASIGVLVLCLLLTGAAALFSMNISNALKSIESQNSITVYLNDDVETEAALEIGEKIRVLPNISNCNFYSKEEAVEKFKDELGSIFDGIKDNNPFPHAFHVTLSDISKYNDTVDQIKKIDGIDSVVNRSELFEKLTKYLEDFDGTVTIKVEGNEQIAETRVSYQGITYKAVTAHKDLYASIDKDIDILEGQIRKFKTKN